MAKKSTESWTSLGKDYHSMIGKAIHNPHLAYNPQTPVTDKGSALARRGFLKFDLILVLPMLILFCKCDMDYKR